MLRRLGSWQQRARPPRLLVMINPHSGQGRCASALQLTFLPDFLGKSSRWVMDSQSLPSGSFLCHTFNREHCMDSSPHRYQVCWHAATHYCATL